MRSDRVNICITTWMPLDVRHTATSAIESHRDGTRNPPRRSPQLPLPFAEPLWALSGGKVTAVPSASPFHLRTRCRQHAHTHTTLTSRPTSDDEQKSRAAGLSILYTCVHRQKARADDPEKVFDIV